MLNLNLPQTSLYYGSSYIPMDQNALSFDVYCQFLVRFHFHYRNLDPDYGLTMIWSGLSHYYLTEELNPHGGAWLQGMNVPKIQRVTGLEISLAMPVGWKEKLNSTDYKLNAGWHKVRVVQVSSLVDMVKFHKIGPGI